MLVSHELSCIFLAHFSRQRPCQFNYGQEELDGELTADRVIRAVDVLLETVKVLFLDYIHAFTIELLDKIMNFWSVPVLVRSELEAPTPMTEVTRYYENGSLLHKKRQ